VINWRFTDTQESLASTLEHGALTSISGEAAPNAVATVTTTRTVFESVILGQRTLAEAMEHREITTIGDANAVSDLWALVVEFQTGFPIVEPAGLTLPDAAMVNPSDSMPSRAAGEIRGTVVRDANRWSQLCLLDRVMPFAMARSRTFSVRN
jgi:alkyl sulfatase BDS1-like metallo-beta-lactamase superfamily hydrolase